MQGVNHHYTREERERLANVESIDYLPPNSEVYRRWLAGQPHRWPFSHNVTWQLRMLPSHIDKPGVRAFMATLWYGLSCNWSPRQGILDAWSGEAGKPEIQCRNVQSGHANRLCSVCS